MKSYESLVTWLEESRKELERLRAEWNKALADWASTQMLEQIGDDMFRARITIEVLEKVLKE